MPETVPVKAVHVSIEEPGMLVELMVSTLAQEFIKEDTHYKYGAQFIKDYIEHVKIKAVVDALSKYPFLSAHVYNAYKDTK